MAGLAVSDPVKLEYIVKSQRIIPGDTIVLLPGIYDAPDGKYIFELNGTEALPIIIKPFTQGTVRINGGIEITGDKSSYIKLLDLEIAPTPIERSFLDRESVNFENALNITGAGCTVAGCYIHDGQQNMLLYGIGTAKITENIFNGGGFMLPDGGHGTNIYTHNHSGGNVEIYNNLFNACFSSHTLNHWSETINNVIGYYSHNNVFIGKRPFFGGGSGTVDNNRFYNNHIYNGLIRLGVENENNKITDVQYNRVYSDDYTFYLFYQRQAIVKNNIFVSKSGGFTFENTSKYESSNIFDENVHYYRDNLPAYYTDLQLAINLQQWQALGYDLNSTYIQGLPITNEIFVYRYSESGRWVGMIVIWNWELLESVSVDLSTICEVDTSYKLRQMQDYDDTANFDYIGEAVSISMLNHTVKKPIAWEEELNATTFPTFGCFVVEKK